MLRSRGDASETVTGECQCGNRRDRERSTPSWSARVCQQNWPYRSWPNAAASEVRRPRRDIAVARFAMPPGEHPMPSVKTSVPPLGSEDSPVKMMSRNTVPDRKTSNGGSSGRRIFASGSWAGPRPTIPPSSHDVEDAEDAAPPTGPCGGASVPTGTSEAAPDSEPMRNSLQSGDRATVAFAGSPSPGRYPPQDDGESPALA